MRANGDAAALPAFTQSWWKYSAAPWSIRCSLRCHSSRLVLRAVRSTSATKASNQTIDDASSASGCSTSGSKLIAPGRAASATLVPPLADRKGGVQGKSGSACVDVGGLRLFKNNIITDDKIRK